MKFAALGLDDRSVPCTDIRRTVAVGPDVRSRPATGNGSGCLFIHACEALDLVRNHRQKEDYFSATVVRPHTNPMLRRQAAASVRILSPRIT
jgi:hypothetical protein